MRLPEASEQIRLAPLRALRAVFSGVGQLVLATDRLREQDAAEEAGQLHADDDQHDSLAGWNGRLSSSVRLIPPGQTAESYTGPGPARHRQSKATKNSKTGKRRKTASANLRPDRSKSPGKPSRFRSLDLTGNVRMLSDHDIAELAADEYERSAAPGAPLPIDGYDELSLPSLRARLRHLDVAQLKVLLAHERSHAQRDDVVTMFERRIARLAEADDI